MAIPAPLPLLPLVQHIFEVAGDPREREEETASAASAASVDANVDRARELRLEGSYEDAAALYRLALEGAQTQSDEIAVAAAESYLAAGDYLPAVAMADRALRENPERLEAGIVKGEALLALGRTDDARELFEDAAAAKLIGGYAAFRAAELAADAGDDEEARGLYARAVEQGVNSWWETVAARRVGRDYLADGALSEAITWLSRAADAALVVERRASPVWFDGELVRRNGETRRAPILLDLARAQLRSGLSDDASQTYATLVLGYPATTEARDGLGALVDLRTVGRLTWYQRGLVLFNAGRPQDAIAAFSAYLASGATEDRAAARYYLGLALRNAGDRSGAIDELAAMAQAEPGDRLAPEALWQVARMAEASRGWGDAIAAYFDVADHFPASEQAGQALSHIADLYIQGGDASAARAVWQRQGQYGPTPSNRAEGLFWLGRSLLRQGDTADGRSLLAEAATQSPFTFEGVRARDLVEGGFGAEAFSRQWTVRAGLAPADDEAACAGWAASWDGSASNGDAVALTVARVDRLLAVGLRGAALAEALDASGVTDRRPIDLHRLAVAFNARALYPASMQAALRLGKLSPAGSAEEGPACLQRLVYPIVFPDLVQAEAQRYGLDPLYLTALLRQESWFDSHALSGAQARGMSQIISDTRRIIGRSLGQTSVTDLDLYRPRVAIAFGAFFLADTYHSLQERPILALAGYNAGPGQARRWTRGNMDIDPDTYVDGIDYGETRNYVRSIYQMYARYRSLY